MKIIKTAFIIAAIAATAACRNSHTGQWQSIHPDKELNGWKIDGNQNQFGFSADTLLLTGNSTLYYTGGTHSAQFRNFELMAEIKTKPNTVAAIWFHSGNASGYQVLINNTTGSHERRTTGSLSYVRNLYKSIATNGQWFTLHIKVVEKHITVKVNNQLVVDYVEPDAPYRTDQNRGMRIARGTFALSSYTPQPVMVSSIHLRPLPNNEQPERTEAIDEHNNRIIRLQQTNFPVIDYHIHLKGWTREEALAHSRQTGIFYGIAPNCGIGFPITSDADIAEYLHTTGNHSCFNAMQGEGREWPTTFADSSRNAFDYTFTDAMTFADHKGRRTRLWIPSEVSIDISHERYMDIIVDRIVKVLKDEPIDLYVNPTYLPEAMMPNYDLLWTDARINKISEAVVTRGIALEINASSRLPSEKIIRAAKNAGIKFAFGTNNTDANVGQLEYCIEMIDRCGLTERDIFFPKGK
jgi:hypothetical protein